MAFGCGQIGCSEDPLVQVYRQRLEMLRLCGMCSDDQLEEVTGGLLVVQGLMQGAEAMVQLGYESALSMSRGEFGELEPAKKDFLRSLVAERLVAGTYAEHWLGSTDTWIAVVGPASQTVIVGQGQDQWPSAEELIAMSADNADKQVWILERPDGKI